MCDVEAQTKSMANLKVVYLKLYLKSSLHCGYLILNVFVLLWGCLRFMTISGDSQTEISDLKWYGPLYLTNWNYAFQTVFLFLALTHDVLEWLDKHQSTIACKIRYWRDIAFNAGVVPYTCFVFGMFWGLYAIDRELVFPKVYDTVIPWWFNHCVHTNILVLVIVETLLQERRKPTNEKLEVTILATVGVLYSIVYYSIYFIAHRWLYNIFGIMTWWQVCIYQLCNWASSYIFYKLFFAINRFIHGADPEEKQNIQNSEKIEVIKQNGETCEKTENLQGNVTLKDNAETEKNVLVKDSEEAERLGSSDCTEVVGNVNGEDDKSDLAFAKKSWSLKYRSLRNQDKKESL